MIIKYSTTINNRLVEVEFKTTNLDGHSVLADYQQTIEHKFTEMMREIARLVIKYEDSKQ